MQDITSNIKRFFTKSYNEDNSIPYAWYNIQYFILSKEQKQKLCDYVIKNKFVRYLFIVNNIEETRPQRTWGSTPEWFRPNSMWKYFNDVNSCNSFIFVVYNTSWGNDIKVEQIKKAIKSFPIKCDITIYFKNSKQIREQGEVRWKVEFM